MKGRPKRRGKRQTRRVLLMVALYPAVLAASSIYRLSPPNYILYCGCVQGIWLRADRQPGFKCAACAKHLRKVPSHDALVACFRIGGMMAVCDAAAGLLQGLEG